jgi:hypothetical protein
MVLWIPDAVPIGGPALDKAEEIISKVANQPLAWWLTAITIGSLLCVYLVVRRMLQSQKESNLALLTMVKEKDDHIKHLNEKLIELLETRWNAR